MEYKLPHLGKIYIQDYDYSCGPCCILNILNLKGQGLKYTEEEMIVCCHANEEDGTTLEGMKQGLEIAQLNIEEEKNPATIADIRRHLDQKHLVIINYFHLYAEVGHFGVVFDSDPEGLYFLDSSLGLLRLDDIDLEKFWYNSDKTLHRYMLAVS